MSSLVNRFDKTARGPALILNRRDPELNRMASYADINVAEMDQLWSVLAHYLRQHGFSKVIRAINTKFEEALMTLSPPQWEALEETETTETPIETSGSSISQIKKLSSIFVNATNHKDQIRGGTG